MHITATANDGVKNAVRLYGRQLLYRRLSVYGTGTTINATTNTAAAAAVITFSRRRPHQRWSLANFSV
jgi:hypothetical protein